MFNGSVPVATLFRRALKHPRRGAFQDRRPKFAKALRDRMVPRWWPFNSPRPRRGRNPESLRPSSKVSSAGYNYTTSEASTDFESTREGDSVGVEGEAARVFSWCRTPISKLREPLPSGSELMSIDTALTEVSSQSLGSEISKIVQEAWQTHYQFVRHITPGNQGQVDIYRHKPTNKLTIVKTIRTGKDIPLEAIILKDYIKPHPNLVELHALFYDPKLHTCNIVMEYCSGGDLFDFTSHWLYVRNQPIPEIFLLHFIASIGEALGFLHLGYRLSNENGFGMPAVIKDKNHVPVLHRDIKLENIFLRRSPYNDYALPYIVLGDFGGAVLESQSSGGFGTSGYFPPEVLRYMQDEDSYQDDESKGMVMTKASDIYTFGVTLSYMMLWGDYVPGMDMEPAFKKSNLRNWGLLLSFMSNCLADDPHDRPSTETFFNLAAVLKLHVRSLYDHGIIMPENSWPQSAAAGEPNHSVPQSSSVDSQDSDPTSVEEIVNKVASCSTTRNASVCAAGQIHNQSVEESIVEQGETDARLKASTASNLSNESVASAALAESAPNATIHSVSFVHTQRAVEVTVKPRKRSTAQRISTTWRASLLYEIVESMANNLLSNIRPARTRASLADRKPSNRASEPPTNALSGEQAGRAELVSKFSDDSDLD